MAEEKTVFPEMTEQELKQLAILQEQLKKEAELRARTAAEAEKEIAEMLAKGGNTLVSRETLTSFLYTASQIDDNNEEAKAAELTSFIKALLRAGVYDSVENAQENGVPEGTFVIIDDPNTEETEFTIAVVTAYVVEEKVAEEVAAKALAEEA